MSHQERFDIELFFKAFADRTRLRLLNLMCEDEVCVCFFVEVLQASQPKISRHLAYLRRAGLVSARRQAKWMHYRITPPRDVHARRVLELMLTWFKEDRKMTEDRKRLVNLCCSPQATVHIQSAPRPSRMGLSK
ncbi:MAG: ArsR/SmtB family transcription factor [Pyrinomonadaceae bacterium]